LIPGEDLVALDEALSDLAGVDERKSRVVELRFFRRADRGRNGRCARGLARDGEAIFDGTLKQGLAMQLEQSPFLRLFPEPQVRHRLGLMGRPPGERVTARGSEPAQSCQAYQQFFALWKDADSDLPPLRAAREESGQVCH
jgi:hypothetical protein